MGEEQQPTSWAMVPTTAHLDAVTDLITKRIDEGFAGVNARMDRLEDDMRPQLLEQAKELAVLKDRALRAETAANHASRHVEHAKKTTRNRATAWGAGAAGFVWGLIKFIESIKPLLPGH